MALPTQKVANAVSGTTQSSTVLFSGQSGMHGGVGGKGRARSKQPHRILKKPTLSRPPAQRSVFALHMLALPVTLLTKLPGGRRVREQL